MYNIRKLSIISSIEEDTRVHYPIYSVNGEDYFFFFNSNARKLSFNYLTYAFEYINAKQIIVKYETGYTPEIVINYDQELRKLLFDF